MRWPQPQASNFNTADERQWSARKKKDQRRRHVKPRLAGSSKPSCSRRTRRDGLRPTLRSCRSSCGRNSARQAMPSFAPFGHKVSGITAALP
jgi:hypothetical protein